MGAGRYLLRGRYRVAMHFPNFRISSYQVAKLSRMLEDLRHEPVYSYP